MANQLVTKARRLLEVPSSFRATALAFPEKVDQAIALVSDVAGAKQLLDQAHLLSQYAKRIKADTEITNAIQYGKLKIVANLGELMPAKSRQEAGEMKGKKGAVPGAGPFSTHTIAAYRKVARNKILIDEYYQSCQPSNGESIPEVSIAGFLSYYSEQLRKESQAERQDPELLKSYGVITSLRELVDAGVKFQTIYADPPWQYSNKATRAAVDGDNDSAYKSTMTVEEICAEPVSQLVADKAHLHLWTTNAFLFEAKRVIEAWGFEYKSCFVWVKPQLGIGNYWRVSHEFMLLGVRGGLRFKTKSEKSWLEIDRVGHSIKPREVRELVEKVSYGPYLEMYGREALPSPWTVYGNEIRESLFHGVVANDGSMRQRSDATTSL